MCTTRKRGLGYFAFDTLFLNKILKVNMLIFLRCIIYYYLKEEHNSKYDEIKGISTIVPITGKKKDGS